MKLIFSEYKSNYSSYTFPYSVYAVPDDIAEVPKIFAEGFCPYTGDISKDEDLFYKARSIRVDLEKFSDTSENRRIDRKVQDLEIEFSANSKSDLSLDSISTFCLDYAEKRFDGGSLSIDRLSYIYQKEYFNYILLYSIGEEKIAYVFCHLSNNLLYYWYSFFNTTYLKDYSIGKWVMWKTIHWAQEKNLSYIYLGTCYSPYSLYKVRDHKGVEYHNGNTWSTQTKILKDLCKYDAEEWNEDLFKTKKFDIE